MRYNHVDVDGSQTGSRPEAIATEKNAVKDVNSSITEVGNQEL